MKLRIVAVILLSLSIGFIVGPLIGLVYFWLNHVVLRDNYAVAILGTFMELLGFLLYLLACVVDAHSDLHNEEVSIW